MEVYRWARNGTSALKPGATLYDDLRCARSNQERHPIVRA